MNFQELYKLPKVELHCHLDGSLDPSFVEESIGRKINMEEIQVSETCTDLAEYLDKFQLPIASLHSVETLHKSAVSFMRMIHEENVRYAEVRFAPLHHIHENLTSVEVIEAVLEGLEEGKKETGIEYGLILCCMRHHSEEENRQLMRDALPYLRKGLCAFDLAGGEVPAPMIQYMDLFHYARELGYPLTIHAGECGNVQNIVDSIRVGASRIGHGIAMTGQEDVKRLCKENRIVLEMCPISNIQTKAIDQIENYPLREFLEEGLLVTINTDNRTVSGTSLTREYAWIQEKYDISDAEVKQMIRTAMEASFASEDVKKKILAELAE